MYPEGKSEAANRLSVVDAGREYRTLVAGAGVGVKNYQNCSVHPGGRLLAVASAEGVSLIDLATGAEREFLPCNCSCVLFEPDGGLLANTTAGLFRWPVRADSGDPRGILVGPPERVPVSAWEGSLARSADGTVLAAANRSGATVWHPARPREAIQFLPHGDCRAVAVSPDGKLVATGNFGGRGLKVWEAATGRLVRTLLPDFPGTNAVFSPDGRWLVNQRGESWRTADWSEGPRHPGPEGPAFSPDGRLAAWSGKGFVTLTDPDTGRELARLEDPHQDGLGLLTFSPDGTLLIGATNDSFCVRVWDLRKIRQGLAELGLDWDPRPYPPAKEPGRGGTDPRPLQVEVIDRPPPSGERTDAYRRDAALYTVAAALQPLNHEAHFRRGEALYYLGTLPTARDDFTRALALNPRHFEAYHLRGHSHERLGNWQQAVVDFDRAIDLRPDDAHLLDSRARCHLRLNQHEEAFRDWEQSLALQPNQLAVQKDLARELNNRAWKLLTAPVDARQPAKAVPLARRAAELEPNSQLYLNTLGVAFYRTDQTREALATLEKSLAAGKGELVAFDLFFLAMCHAKVGDTAKARDHFDRAVKWVEEKKGRLDTGHLAELNLFHAEAAAVLGLMPSPAK